jgi:F0F1-type ATP synthase membrane subunit b/b'
LKNNALIKKLKGENEDLEVKRKGADAEIATEDVLDDATENASKNFAKKIMKGEEESAMTTANAKHKIGKANKD